MKGLSVCGVNLKCMKHVEFPNSLAKVGTISSNLKMAQGTIRSELKKELIQNKF